MDLTANTAVAWIILGLIIGLGAAFIVPGHESSHRFETVLTAVLGSTVGGLIAYALKIGADTRSPAGWMVAVIASGLSVAAYYSAPGIRKPV